MIFSNISNKIVSRRADCQQTGYTDVLFCSCDLDLDPVTLVYELV